MTYVSKVEDDFIDDDAFTGCGRITLQMLTIAGHDDLPLKSRLTAIINRWEAQGAKSRSEADIENEDVGSEDIEHEDINSLTEHLSHLPTITDPEIWRVRVHVI